MSALIPLRRSISMANMEKRRRIKDLLYEAIKQRDDETLHFVEAEMAGHLNYMLNYRILSEPFRSFVKKDMVDIWMLGHLQDTMAINYFRNVKTLYPMNTPGDGNCLLHAVSLAMWSFTDHNAMLRRLVYIALSTENNHFYKRWIHRQKRLDREEANFVLSQETLDQMWDEVKENASDSNRTSPDQLRYRTLEHIHIFVLSNILRRPIIVISDTHVHYPSGSVHESAHIFDGIYLPIFWLPSDCIKSPLVLGYGNNHFAPLLGMDNRMLESDPRSSPTRGSKMIPQDVIPLVKYDLRQRSIHFLLDREEASSANLLEDYLKLREVPQTGADTVDMILCAEIEYKPLYEDLNLIWDHYEELQKKFRLKMDEASHQNIKPVEPMEVDPGSQGNDVGLNLNLSEDPKAVEVQRKDIEHLSMPREPYPEDWSLMHDTCAFDACRYRASHHTKPYCHDHAKAKRSPKESEEKILNLNLSEIDETGAAGFPENTKPSNCPIKDCKLAPEEKYEGFCVVHKPEKECLVPNCDCKGINTPEKKKKCQRRANECFHGQCAECFSKEPLAQELPKCIAEGCNSPGTPRHGDYCSECVRTSGLKQDDLDILRKLPERPEAERENVQRLYKCEVDNCFAASTASTLGHCTKHFLLKYRAAVIDIPTAEEVQQFKEKMARKVAKQNSNKLAPPENKQRKKNSSGQVREKKFLCATPGCGGVRLKDNELCYQCLRHEKYEQPQEPIVLKNFHVPSEREAMVTGEDDVIESAPPSEENTPPNTPTAEPRQARKKQCLGPACSGTGLETYSGLCISCYNVLQANNMANVEMPPSIILQNRQEREPIEYPARQCRTSGCGMFGRRNQNGFCSRCYSKQQKGLILAEESKKALQRNFTTLCENMQPQEVIDLLYSNMVFSTSQMEEARHTRTDTGKAKYVLQQLLHRGDERAYNVFVQALVNTGQQHLAQLLRSTTQDPPPVSRPTENRHGNSRPRRNHPSTTYSHGGPKPCLSKSCDRYGEGALHGFCFSCARNGGLLEQIASATHTHTYVTGPVRPSQSSARTHAQSSTNRTGSSSGTRGSNATTGANLRHRHMDIETYTASMESEEHGPSGHHSQLVISGTEFEQTNYKPLNKKCKYPNCPNFGNPKRSGYCNEGHSVPDY